MKTPIYLLIVLCVAAMSCGCVSKAIYKDAAESGWQSWDKDRRPGVPDDEYAKMSDDEQELYRPFSFYEARRFERDQALNLLD